MVYKHYFKTGDCTIIHKMNVKNKKVSGCKVISTFRGWRGRSSKRNGGKRGASEIQGVSGKNM